MHHSPNGLSLPSRWTDIVCLLLLSFAVLLLFETSPRQGDFWLSDAPRHAMDGVFYYDMGRALPITHPKQWAMNYYLQYPAVTVLIYPPLFALVEAVFFALFGVSHHAAQLTVSAFFLATAWGTYYFVRRWVGCMAALATTLLFIGTPVMALWGRQVMLEIPTFAFLMWSAYFFFRYLDLARAGDLYLTALLLLGAAYTRQTAVFILPACLLTLYAVRRNALFRRPDFWWSAALFIVGIAPLGVYTWLWSGVYVQEAVGGGLIKHSRLSTATWLYIACYQWPRQMGWVVTALAAVYCIGCALRRGWRLPKPALFFSPPGCLSDMHSSPSLLYLLSVTVYFSVSAGILFDTCNPPLFACKNSFLCRPGICDLEFLLRSGQEPRSVHTRVPGCCSIRLLHGATKQRSSVFRGARWAIRFNIRSLPECRKLTVIRADKLLVRVAINRNLFGLQELGVSESRLKQMLEQLGVRYVVVEPNFWNDLQSMHMLAGILHKDHFRLLTAISTANNWSPTTRSWRSMKSAPVSKGRNVLKVEFPMSGIAIEGTVGQDSVNK